MKTYKNSPKKTSTNKTSTNKSSENKNTVSTNSIFVTIDENFNYLNTKLGKDIGLAQGKYDILSGKAQAGIAYIESMADKIFISNQVIEPLLKEKTDSKTSPENITTLIQSKFIYAANIKATININEIVDSLLNGDTALFINGTNTALIIGTRKVEKRAIEKPTNENDVSGSLDSFIEDIDTNCGMVLKRLPIPDLRFEAFTVGKLSKSKVLVLWIEGVANIKSVNEVKERIKRINIDFVEGIGALTELIEDKPSSVFPKSRQTSRPDITTKFLTDGHFAVLCSNSPYAFIAPITFWDNFKTMDDYAQNSSISSYLRVTRIVAFILSIIISPMYLSFVTYNHSIVPPPLALNIASGREGVPFPSVVEVIVLTLGITIIREASLRIAGTIGFFIGTLSSVVIGQAAVTAGYVSASVIIVTAVSAVSSFAVATPAMLYTSRFVNYLMIILSGFFGMFGLINGVVIVLWYAISLESFGVPYLYPLVPFVKDGLKDIFIRSRLSGLKKRLRIFAPYNRTRMNNKGE